MLFAHITFSFLLSGESVTFFQADFYGFLLSETDMMDQRPQTNIANFMFHAMRIWSQCRVHWLVQYPIDSPEMWLDDETWDLFHRRFTHGPHRPAQWPKPDLVSVCTSPDFVTPAVTQELLKVLSCFTTKTQRGRCSIG